MFACVFGSKSKTAAIAKEKNVEEQVEDTNRPSWLQLWGVLAWRVESSGSDFVLCSCCFV